MNHRMRCVALESLNRGLYCCEYGGGTVQVRFGRR